MHAPARNVPVASEKADRPVTPAGAATAAAIEVVYEVECSLDPSIVADFDVWLPGHVDMVLASPGFLGAEMLRPLEPSPDGRVRRINRYRVRDRAALDHYLEQLAPALRQDGANRFGDRATYTRRVLASTATHLPDGAIERCGNCDARLAGPYCAACGQHAHESSRSLGALFHDAWHVLTHVDGRFWQTLRRLAFSPGYLTNEYFRERRASYVPPFRLYLVLSLVFFGLASLSSAFETEPRVVAATPEQVEAAKADIARQRAELKAQGGGAIADAALGAVEKSVDRAAARAAEGAAASSGPGTGTGTGAGAGTGAAAAAEDPAFRVSSKLGADDDDFRFDPKDCDRTHVRPKFLEPAVKKACYRASADGGKSIAHAFVANVPKMMFVFLPLIAAAMLLLYWRPRRYYVEHLVFYLHTHAALFLAFATVLLLGLLGLLAPPLEVVADVGKLAAMLYALWYVWRAMRVHYGNGRALTAVKFVVIGMFYVVFLSLTLAGTALVSALTA